MALDEIYKEVILDHYKSPRNKRALADAAFTCSRNNPLCGDEIRVSANVEGDVLTEVTFQGAGCSISQSSASMMTEAVTGASVADALELAADFRGMMAGEVEPDEDRFGDLVALKGVVKYPIRIKCAVLAWDVLQEALQGDGEAGGTHRPTDARDAIGCGRALARPPLPCLRVHRGAAGVRADARAGRSRVDHRTTTSRSRSSPTATSRS